MALKFDFDWKEFLMQKGEKIGLGLGVAVLGLMLVVGLKGAFSASPSSNAADLNKKTAEANRKLKENQPRDMSQFAVADELMKTAANLDYVNPKDYQELTSL